MDHRWLKKLTAACCTLALVLMLSPAVWAASQNNGNKYQMGELLEIGDPSCKHYFSFGNPFEDIKTTCTEAGYLVLICPYCGAKKVSSISYPIGHEFINGVCYKCGIAESSVPPPTDDPSTPAVGLNSTETYPTLAGVEPSNVKVSRSDRGIPLRAKGSGYELIWVKGDLVYMNGTVEDDTRRLLVDSYDASFHRTDSKQLEIELEEIGGFYYGENYNFIVFGQNNIDEDNSREVLRIVKYSKDWKRLGAASIRNVGIADVVGQHGNRSFAECDGMLYIHSGRTTYARADGNQHQTNMTICIRESDMTMTDSHITVDNLSTGYVSRSMQQDIMVDSQKNLITLDTGDSYPRGAYLFRYPKKAGGETFTGKGTGALLAKWPGESGNVNTGAATCALVETRDGYLSAYVDTGNGSDYNPSKPSTAYLVFTPRDQFSAETSVTRPLVQGTTTESPNHIYLIPTSMDSGYVLWYTLTKKENSYSFSVTNGMNMYCARYNADGTFGPNVKLEDAPAPYIGPVYTGDKLVWGGDPTNRLKPLQFCTLDGDGTLKVYTAFHGNPFTDVPYGSYYHDAVLWALEHGVTTGVTAAQFQPDTPCSRGQVVTFLWRVKGSPEPQTKKNPFTDVSDSSPFYKAILWAYENNITTGTTAAAFSPDRACSSAHVVTFLWRANGKPAAAGTSALASKYPGQYYTDAVAWADARGLLDGVGGAFTPSQNSPRADIVTYLYRDLAQ